VHFLHYYLPQYNSVTSVDLRHSLLPRAVPAGMQHNEKKEEVDGAHKVQPEHRSRKRLVHGRRTLQGLVWRFFLVSSNAIIEAVLLDVMAISLGADAVRMEKG
jgi:hypothetical protein